MEHSAVYSMKRHGTVKVLVSAISTGGSSLTNEGMVKMRSTMGASIYIQDQIAAVLANMAANSDCREEVVKHGGLPVLLELLDAKCPKPPEKPEEHAQIAATERVLQKSAIAISR